MCDINKFLKELINKLELRFENNFTGLILFGSYARGNEKKGSDIDLIITFKKIPKNRLERLRLVEDIIDELESKYKIEINPIISNENKMQKSYLMADIADYSKIIVDKNRKITRLFNSINKDYAKGLIKKKTVGNHYMLWMSDNIRS